MLKHLVIVVQLTYWTVHHQLFPFQFCINPFNRRVDKSLQLNQRSLRLNTIFILKLKSLDDLDFTTTLSYYFKLFMVSSRSQFPAKIFFTSFLDEMLNSSFHCYTSVWLFLSIIIHFIMWSMYHKGEVSEVIFGNSVRPIRYEGDGGGGFFARPFCTMFTSLKS